MIVTKSNSIKLASLLLFANGLSAVVFNFSILSIEMLPLEDPSIIEILPEESLATEDQFAQLTSIRNVLSILIGIITLITSWFLLHKKLWAFIAALIISIGSIAFHAYTYIQFSFTNSYSLAISGLILVLLLIGSNEFKKI